MSTNIKNELFHLVVSRWLCHPETFTVKGIKADPDDFGDQEDRDYQNAEPWSCADMHFTPKPATQEILAKYSIDVDQYNEIASALENALSFGCCGLCV